MNPYFIWISEVMSQQSTMPSVIPYFEKWILRFPTLEVLANAKEEEVLSAWAGLGYYSRARNILKAAKEIENFQKQNGRWPLKAEEWSSFPGIGPYTSRAIASIAFSEPVLPIDGNVIRVFSRLFAIEDALNSKLDRNKIEALAGQFSSLASQTTHTPGQLSQAFMELGSQICKPQKGALCAACPLEAACLGHKKNIQNKIPFKKKRANIEELFQIALYYENTKKQVLLRRIPPQLRLAGQYELPLWTLGHKAQAIKIIDKLSSRFEVLGPVSHSITKHRYRVFLLKTGQKWTGPLPEAHVFKAPKDHDPKVIESTLSKKLYKLINF